MKISWWMAVKEVQRRQENFDIKLINQNNR
jgi:hypothetical protein